MLKSSSIFDFSSIGARLIATALAAAITDLGMDSAFDVRVPRTRIEVDEAREAGAVVLVPDKTHVHTGGMRMSHRTLSLLHLRAFAVREIEELVKHPGCSSRGAAPSPRHGPSRPTTRPSSCSTPTASVTPTCLRTSSRRSNCRMAAPRKSVVTWTAGKSSCRKPRSAARSLNSSPVSPLQPEDFFGLFLSWRS